MPSLNIVNEEDFFSIFSLKCASDLKKWIFPIPSILSSYFKLWDHFAPSDTAMALMRRVWGNIGKMAKLRKRTKNGQNGQKYSKNEKQIFSSFRSLYPVLNGHFPPSCIALPLMIRIWANMDHMAKWPQRNKNRQKIPQKAPKMNIFRSHYFLSSYLKP